MADTKISALSSAGALGGTEVLPIVQGGATVKVALDDLVPLVEAELPSFFATLRTLSPGNDTPINSYATDLDGYASDIAQAQALLDAAQSVGVPTSALNVLRAAPACRATDLTAELDTPAALAFAAPAAPLAGMPARATDL
jgi:hypothetical protein